jgi:hypothetical protein
VPNRNSRTDRLQSLSRVRTLCRASPKIQIGRPSGLNFLIFSDFRYTFFFPKNRLIFGSPQIAPKSQKFDLGAFSAPILVVFGTQFDTNFLNISRFPENLYFATSIKRNARFYLPNPLILGSIFNQNLMFFRVSFLDALFSSFFQDDTQNHDFGTLLESSSVQNGAQNRPSGARGANKKHKIATVLGGPGTDLFPESIPIDFLWILVDF